MHANPGRGGSPAYAIAAPLQAESTYSVPVQVSVLPHRIALAIGYSVTAVAIVVLLGWALDVQVAKSIFPGQARMAPATALGFLFAGMALIVLCSERPAGAVEGVRLITVRALALLAALIGVLKWGDYLFGWDLSFDTLGFRDTAYVAPATALDFVLIGSALFVGFGDQFFALFQNLVLGTGLVAWLGFVSFVSGGERLPVYAQMAVHTSLSFFLLSIGVLCTRDDRGLMSLLTGRNIAGRKILWLLALAPPLPLAIDLVEQLVDQTSQFGAANLTPIFAVLDTILLAAMIWAFGDRLQRVDVRRAQEQAKRREYEARLALFVEHAPAAIAMFDCDMRYVAVSRRWLSENRLDLEEIRGRTHYEVFPEIPKRWREIHRRCMAGNVERNERDRMERGGGRLDWARWEIRPWYVEEGQVGGIILLSEVITERVEAEERARRLNRVYAVLSGINTLIVRVRDSQTLFDEACRISVELGDFGVTWIGMHHRDSGEIVAVAAAGLPVNHPLIAKLAVTSPPAPDTSLPGRSILSGKVELENNLGTSRLQESARYKEIIDLGYRATITLPLMVDDFATGCISMWSRKEDVFDDDELKLLLEIANDISFALQYLTKREELDYISYYDVLTELPNRALFLDRVGQELRRRAKSKKSVALLAIDIERFRYVNETLGRHGGDALLRAIAKRLKFSCPEDSILARMGPNSFAVALPDAADPSDVAHMIERIALESFRAPFTIFETEVRIAAKVGAALYPSDGDNSDALFGNAEAALKRAKDTGERYLFYSAEMNARTAERLTLETRLRRAVDSGEFVLFYQPKVRLDTSEMCGLEALIRWNDPERGLIRPSEFIPILEDTGLIVEAGRWAMERAISDYKDWQSAGYRVPRVAVNVSPTQLQRDGFVSEVMDLFQMLGTDPEALELEITESLIMKNVENSNRVLSVLRGAGVHVSMDDFGTGYSSLSYLASLPVDKIKIDRSFIAGMTENALDHKVVSTIISLAHSFELPVVAEGVETVEQAQALHELNCDEAQGFLFSPPLPSDEIMGLFGTLAL